ncbi:MAG: winged helix-turn-helix domain-containing protein [Xanthobacteraceae bacterium]|nr:winged helix-turn-helix domain-containing protein [Xanthobacteraceae bacterium]
MDREALRAWRGTIELNLSLRQLRILEIFMERPGQIISRAFIRSTVWGPATTVSGNNVDVEIGHLRKILRGADNDHPIKTVRGSGFTFEPKEAQTHG